MDTRDTHTIVKVKRFLQSEILPHLPEPPTGAEFKELLLPFNPPGNDFDLEYVRGSAYLAYLGLRSQGYNLLTPLTEVVMPADGCAYFWFHAAKTVRH